MDLKSSMKIAASGMEVQSHRIKVIAENIANKDSIASTPGGEPYRRKTISFKNVMDNEIGAHIIKVDKVGLDSSPFKKIYNPGHPAADDYGYIMKPNVNSMIESVDLKEAQRSYEANLATIEVTKSMLNRTLDLLR
jgi:flagellar basal-body rod protein FlgC